MVVEVVGNDCVVVEAVVVGEDCTVVEVAVVVVVDDDSKNAFCEVNKNSHDQFLKIVFFEWEKSYFLFRKKCILPSLI
jgi:hypothetical protein